MPLVYVGQPYAPPRGLPLYNRAGSELKVSDTVASKLQTALLDLFCSSQQAAVKVDVPYAVLPCYIKGRAQRVGIAAV